LSASEFIFAAGAAAIGIAAGSLSIYAFSRNNGREKVPITRPVPAENSNSQPERPSNSPNDGIPSETNAAPRFNEYERTIPKSELEKSKRELRTLLLEKELVSAALTRLYEAEAAKEITKPEREILGAKYVSELKALDEKITKMDAFIQIGDLETLRNQLLQLVQQKIDSIDRRIDSTRKLAEPLIAEMTRKVDEQISAPLKIQSIDETQRGTPIPDISDMLEKEKPESQVSSPPINKLPITAPSEVVVAESKSSSPALISEKKRPADKVEELQREILEALDRLERLDVESP
jgi:hypothetical protein